MFFQVKNQLSYVLLLFLISESEEKCHETKSVGSLCYELLYEGLETFSNCKEACVYKVKSDISSNPKKFCFASGNQPVSNQCLPDLSNSLQAYM